MKTFCQWIKESSPTNSTGGGIRGLGNVTGVPGGTISSYAAFNAADTSVSDAVNAMHAATNNTGDVKDGNTADTKNNILKVGKGKK